MTTFRTRSGSIYEVDESRRRIRQLARTASRGGSRRLASGEWVGYSEIEHRGEGSYLYVWFGAESNPVVTSALVEVCEASVTGGYSDAC